MKKYMLFNKFTKNLVVGALGNKELSKLQKKLFPLLFLELLDLFLQFSKFPN